MITAVIADDERLMREQLRHRLAAAWPELQVLAEAADGHQALTLLAEHRPQVAFLDVRMPGLSGMEVVAELARTAQPGWCACEVVFVTAYDEYAVQAFEQGALDYVLKPAQHERLLRTAERLQARLVARRSEPPEMQAQMQQLLLRLTQAQPGATGAAALRWIQASVGQQIQFLPVDEVLFFLADDKYTRVRTASSEALIRKPIRELAAQLDPDQFWQIHRSTLVNVHAIAGVSRDLRGRLQVSLRGCDERLEVSRSYGHLFRGM